MILNNYIYPENVCLGSVLIFAFWYLEFSLATKMKKLSDISLDVVELNSLVIYFYFAIVLYFFDARWNIIVALILFGSSQAVCNILEHSRFIVDAMTFFRFSVVWYVFTWYVNDRSLYWIITFVVYITFRKAQKIYVFLSILPGLVIMGNLVYLDDPYFFISFLNLLFTMLLIFFKHSPLLMDPNFTRQKLRSMYMNIAIPFLLTMLETNFYTQDIFLYNINIKWVPLLT